MSTRKNKIKGRKVTLMALSIMFVMAILPKLAIGQDFCDGNGDVDAYGIPWRAVPPVIPEGMEPEKIEFLIYNDPKETDTYEIYPDRFVVWISDSASISKCIPYPEYITRINHWEGHDWRVYVKTEDAHRGQALKDSLSQLPEVVRIENHVYAEGFELSPFGYVHVSLADAKDSVKLKGLTESLGLILHENAPYINKGHLWDIGIGKGIRATTQEVIEMLQLSGIPEYCEPSWRREAGSIQNFTYDPYIQKQWGLYNLEAVSIPDDDKYTDMDIARAWNIATGNDINICITDYIFDIGNTDISQNCTKTMNIITGKPIEIQDTYNDYHGTACAQIAGAVKNNNYGIAGVAPDANLMLVQFGTDYNSANPNYTDYTQIANAIRWAADNGASIINCSWDTKTNPTLSNAVSYARTQGRDKKGCVVIAAAGNNGTEGEIKAPANIVGVLTVGAVNKDIRRASFSNYGTGLDVVAPGDSIWSISVNGFTSRSGTSFACPAVAGVAALILEAYPQATEAEVREIIALTASLPKGIESTLIDPVLGGWNPEYGYGLVNAYEAVREAVRRAKPGWRVLPMGNPNISDIED